MPATFLAATFTLATEFSEPGVAGDSVFDFHACFGFLDLWFQPVLQAAFSESIDLSESRRRPAAGTALR